MHTVGLPPPVLGTTSTRRVGESEFLRKLCERRLSPGDPSILQAHACLLEHFESVLAEEQRARDGLDPESVHQTHVATCRIRATFRGSRNVLPAAPIRELNREFKWVADVLGHVRDFDVYRSNFREYAAEIPEQDGTCLADYQKHLSEL